MIFGKIGPKKGFYIAFIVLNCVIFFLIWILYLLRNYFHLSGSLVSNIFIGVFIQFLLTCGLGGPFFYKGYLKSHGINTDLSREGIEKQIKENNEKYEKLRKSPNRNKHPGIIRVKNPIVLIKLLLISIFKKKPNKEK